MKQETGILLLHGFTGSPNSMKWLADEFKKQGYLTAVPQLCGHGSQPDNLLSCSYKDWLSDAESALQSLNEKCKSVFIVGLSLGGAISLYLASQHRVTGVVTMAAPFQISFWTRLYARLFYPFVRYQYKESGPDIHDKSALKRMNSYNLYPTRVSLEVFKLLKKMRASIHKVKSPILVLHGRRDHVVSTENADLIYDALTTPVKTKKIFEKSFHILSLDYDKEEVRDSIVDFINRLQQQENMQNIQV